MFTPAISYLITSNLPWFKDLTFHIPMQCFSWQHRTLLSPLDTTTTEHCFLSWPNYFTLPGAISNCPLLFPWRRQWQALQYSCLENPMDGGAWWATVHGVATSRSRLSDFTFTFHFHAMEKEMATHSSVLAWRIPGMAEPGGLLSMGSHRVRHNWSDLAAAAALPSTILDIFQLGVAGGSLIFCWHICLPFHTFHGLLRARILEWVAISFSSWPCFVSSSLWFIHLRWPCIAWLIASLSYASPFTTRLWSMKGIMCHCCFVV